LTATLNTFTTFTFNDGSFQTSADRIMRIRRAPNKLRQRLCLGADFVNGNLLNSTYQQNFWAIGAQALTMYSLGFYGQD
jgi:hypothetical protein